MKTFANAESIKLRAECADTISALTKIYQDLEKLDHSAIANELANCLALLEKFQNKDAGDNSDLCMNKISLRPNF